MGESVAGAISVCEKQVVAIRNKIYRAFLMMAADLLNCDNCSNLLC